MERDHVRSVFPVTSEIEDETLRTGVVDAWALSMDETDVDDLWTVPWFPPVMTSLGIEDETLVDHVHAVTDGAIALAETLRDRRDANVSMDTVIAGALVHDVSKLYEYENGTETAVGNLLGHPYYGVHVVAAGGLPVEIAHIVLSHTNRTTVEPATLEAVLVRRADEAAAAAIRAEAVADLRDA